MAGKMRQPFPALHAATLDPATTPETLRQLLAAADAMPERHRLSEGAVYMSAQRRWTMLTGTDWRAAQQPPEAASWADSDHRYRLMARDGTLVARCSCGEHETATTVEAGDAWHDQHTTQVPA